MIDVEVSPLPWDGTFKYLDTFFWVSSRDRRGRAQSNFELVPHRLYLFSVSTAKLTQPKGVTCKTRYTARFRWERFVWTDVASKVWPWDQFATYPTVHPLKSAFWLEDFKAYSDTVAEKQTEVLSQWAAGTLTEDYVNELSGGML